MMSFLLCHECCTWVQPRAERCPECEAWIDQNHPDPPLHSLRFQLGDILLRIADVHLNRTILPDQGTLYATTTGLYFVPHDVERQTQAQEEVVGPSFLWVLAAFVFWPLGLITPFMKTKRLKHVDVEQFRPYWLTEADSGRLPELLMSNPGAFFVPSRAIHHLYARNGYCVVERKLGKRLMLRPAAGMPGLRERLEQLATHPEWRGLIGQA